MLNTLQHLPGRTSRAWTSAQNMSRVKKKNKKKPKNQKKPNTLKPTYPGIWRKPPTFLACNSFYFFYKVTKLLNAVEGQTLHYRTNACTENKTTLPHGAQISLSRGWMGSGPITFAVPQWILYKAMEQGSRAPHTPQRGTAAHSLPLTPGSSRWSRVSLAPAQTQQMMLITECRTLGRPGCSFGSEDIPCFSIKYLQL